MAEQFEAYEPLSDAELIAQILGGDETAMNYLLKCKCGPPLHYLWQTYSEAKIEWNDFVYAVYFLLAKRDGHSLRNFRAVNLTTGRICQLKTYVLTCARNYLRKLAKKESIRKEKEIDWTSALSDQEGNWIEIPDEKSDITHIKMSIMEAIQALESPKERFVIINYKIEGYSPKEVAEMLNTSEANIYTIASRAIKNLRDIMEGGVYV